ncbi:MAG: hypothetical protein JNJ69_18260 [Leptospiraceae bacterium]|nr:hypothetical protein [Leptospiraceae bacterium]
MRRAALLSTFFCGISLTSIGAEEIPERRWQIAVAAGLNSIVTNNTLLKNNEGAEVGLLTSLPYQLWKEDAAFISVRGQLTNYSNGITLSSTNAIGNPDKLVNAAHSQLRIDYRHIYIYWGIHWSIGLGVQLPVTSRILTPRGEFSFAETKNWYPEAQADIARIDRSTGVYLRLGIDQKLLDEALIAGIAFELMAIEAPRTDQRFALNAYIGARLW